MLFLPEHWGSTLCIGQSDRWSTLSTDLLPDMIRQPKVTMDDMRDVIR